VNIAVFASGRGTNFSAILRAVEKRKIKAKIALLVCDDPEAGVILRAAKAGIKTALFLRKDYLSREAFEGAIIQCLKGHNIDLVVLAGYMRLLSVDFLRHYRNKVLNIHPSLLPSFKGAEGIKDAFVYGVKVTGVTVHFVDEEMDHGPIILQAPVIIEETDTKASLEQKIHRLEHRLYPEAIRLYAQGKLKLEGRKVKIGK